MFGATRPGRVFLVFAAVAACCLGGGAALWFGLIPSVGSGQPPLPPSDVSEALASQLREPPSTEREPVYVGTDLEQVPEVNLEPPPAIALGKYGTHSTEQWLALKSRTRANAVELNDKEEDGFVKALLRTRPDLAGLPFQMGDACRTKGERAMAFKAMAGKVRAALPGADVQKGMTAAERRLFQADSNYRKALVAVLAQIMQEEEAQIQQQRILSLAAIDEPEATRALARVAVFSPHRTVRADALTALAKRGRVSTEVFLAGLRYPHPAVAENAAHALVELQRRDLIPQLTALLDEPDPRDPQVERRGSGKVLVAREVVRINHHRNCLLCHAPAEKGKTPDETVVAETPLPSEPLPNGVAYYNSTRSRSSPRPSPSANLLVRVDVTYLRQDFSVTQEVYDSSAWRVTQRFDFFVRKRVLTPDEARDLRKRLSGDSPYRAAIALALRQLKARES